MSIPLNILQMLIQEQEKKQQAQAQFPLPTNPFQLNNNPISLGFNNTPTASLTPDLSSAPPRFDDSAITPLLTKSQFDYGANNQQIADNTTEFLNLINPRIGNDSSRQIEGLISELKAKQANLPNDVGTSTKLLSSLIAGIGGATGNQALVQQGFNVINEGRNNLKTQKDMLSQQELNLRAEQYKDTLAKENKIRDTYLEQKRIASQYSTDIGVRNMNYATQKALANFEYDSKAKLQADDYKMRVFMFDKQVNSEAEAKKTLFKYDLYKTGGLELVKIFNKIDNGEQVTLEEEKTFYEASERGRLDDTMNFQRQQANERNREDRKLVMGSGVGLIDDSRVRQSVTRYPSDKATTAKLLSSGGKLTTGDQKLDEEIMQAANEEDVPYYVLMALFQQESGFNNGAVSPKGAFSIAQIMPGTAAEFGLDPAKLKSDRAYAIKGGARIFRRTLDFAGGDYEKALVGYNSGTGESYVKSYDPSTKTVIDSKTGVRRSILPETSNYIAKILPKINAAEEFLLNQPEFAAKNQAKQEAINQKVLYSKFDDFTKYKNEVLTNGKKPVYEMATNPTTGQLEPIIDPTTQKPKQKLGLDGKGLTEDMTDREKATQILSMLPYIAGTDVNNKLFQDEAIKIQQNAGLIMPDEQIIPLKENEINTAIEGGATRQKLITFLQNSPNLTSDQISRLIFYADTKLNEKYKARVNIVKEKEKSIESFNIPKQDSIKATSPSILNQNNFKVNQAQQKINIYDAYINSKR